MRIGEVATKTGVSIQTLRYYERRGLLAKPQRSASGFRQYSPGTIEQIRFVRRAQDLGFTLEEIRDLLRMWPDSVKSCSAVERRAADTLGRIDGKIEDLLRMKHALASDTTPSVLRHFGSPTVLVDGHDVGCDETAAPRADANSCRVYFDQQGKCVCGAPSARLILDTIHAVAGR